MARTPAAPKTPVKTPAKPVSKTAAKPARAAKAAAAAPKERPMPVNLPSAPSKELHVFPKIGRAHV